MIIQMPQGTVDGSYTIIANGYDENHVLLGQDSSVVFSYEKTTPVVPDTGNLLNNLNIAQSDILITGLLVFLIATIVAFVVIYRKKEQ